MSDFYEAYSQAYSRAYRYGTNGNPGQSTGDFLNKQKLIKLRGTVNWEVGKDRSRFFRQLISIISDWTDQLPNLRDIFQPKEIEHILLDSINYNYEGLRVIEFVANSGYRDEPDVDRNGKPVSLRTTPIHRAVDLLGFAEPTGMILELFKIYQFNVDYTDESGLTHLHVACMCGCEYIVEKFLEFGHNPNPRQRTSMPFCSLFMPLNYALLRKRRNLALLLLKRGADPNLVDEYERTALHIICGACNDDTELAEMVFDISDEKHRTVHINAQDKSGQTPLHMAVDNKHKMLVKLLLTRGADPNVAEAKGMTPLHLICQRLDDDNVGKYLKIFIDICDENHRKLHVDVQDKFGKTPLQLAVTNLMPEAVNVLLDRGADLSKFIFPSESDFFKRFDPKCGFRLGFKLVLASRAIIIIESLEKKGYELESSDALRIMKFFARHQLFEKSKDVEANLYDYEKFSSQAKEVMISPSVSLHDLMSLQPQESAKLLAFSDCYDYTCNLWWCRREKLHESCFMHLCEKLSRQFFRCWALESFVRLIHYKLPVECCEPIIDQLMNEDLYHICLAAAGQPSKSKTNVKDV